MKIAKQFSRFDVWLLRGRLQFSYERHSGLKTCSGKEFCGWIAAWMDDKSSTLLSEKVRRFTCYWRTVVCSTHVTNVIYKTNHVISS